jgi:membrane protease YdiL (CAAX protease family)
VTILSFIGLVAAGLFLAYAYVITRQLWLPIGLHIGWNFFEGNVFGFPVSGLETFKLITLRVHGPELWTGGAFGPEAGLIVFPALLLGLGLMAGYVYTLRERLT